jgi:hypothetical protein
MGSHFSKFACVILLALCAPAVKSQQAIEEIEMQVSGPPDWDAIFAKAGIDNADPEALVRAARGDNLNLMYGAIEQLRLVPRTQAGVDALLARVRSDNVRIVLAAATTLSSFGETGWAPLVPLRVLEQDRNSAVVLCGLLAKADDYRCWPQMKKWVTDSAFARYVIGNAESFVGMRDSKGLVDIGRELDAVRPKQPDVSTQYLSERVRLWARRTPIHTRSRPWEWEAEHLFAPILARSGIKRSDVSALKKAALTKRDPDTINNDLLAAALYALGQLPPELIGELRLPASSLTEQWDLVHATYALASSRETGWIPLLAPSLPDVTDRRIQQRFASALASAGEYRGWSVTLAAITSDDKELADDAIRCTRDYFGMKDSSGQLVDIASALEARIPEANPELRDLAKQISRELRKMRLKPRGNWTWALI